ncbi:MAG TPA: hypothetical protein DCL15_18620 [Chloroflexi bacterium]|nr:hypothetical protein [Chloroflexota bacterium]
MDLAGKTRLPRAAVRLREAGGEWEEIWVRVETGDWRLEIGDWRLEIHWRSTPNLQSPISKSLNL